VARKKKFLGAEFSDRFKESYAALSHDRQKGTDKVVLALMKQEPTPGMRVKPIQPEKYYNEARINAGDRLVFRVEDGKVWFVDVVEHDDINRYGRKVGGPF
jgi:Txe/YoeB family toxin of Txe-Axe toxin-antitoxin module